MRIGYQGIPGAYGHEAAQTWMERQDQDWELCSFASFQEVIEGLLLGQVDRAILPVENSTTGPVRPVMDLFPYAPVQIVDAVDLPISHVLMGQPEARLEDLVEVYSHPEALSQCQAFFKLYPNLTPMAAQNTAMAAAQVSKGGRLDQAALGSALAARLYGLEILASHLQTEGHNTTRFFVLQHLENQRPQVSGQMVFYLETPHIPGALNQLLKVFEDFGVNLSSLNARPIPMKKFAYGFFLEADGRNLGQVEEDFMLALKAKSHYMQYLGSYPKEEE